MLLLDEPLAALDLKLRQEMRDELKRLQREVGITFVYVTHDQDEAMALSDRMAVMNAGRIEQVGTGQEVYGEPANRFVADFIGSTNFMRAVVTAVDGQTVVARVGGDGGPPLRANAEDVEHNAVCVFSVRPEHIRLAPRGDVQVGENSLPGVVTARTYLGAQVEYRVRVLDTDELTVVSSSTGDSGRIEPGAEVLCQWSVEDSRLLPE